tara:strand:- start:159 stop:998 length:840 start_codon:yes stop_codon:yes gene_type:complete
MNIQHIASYVIDEFNEQNLSQDYEKLKSISEKTPKKYLIKISDLEKIKDEISKETYDKVYSRAFGIDYRHFSSLYLQINSVLKLPKSKVSNILEVGKGIGNLAALIESYGYNYSSLDVNETYNPTKIGSVQKIPWKDNSFDLVCAFEVLEHLPSDQTEVALLEMKRVAKNYVFISIPCQRNSIRFGFGLDFRQWAISRLSFDLNFFSTLPTLSYKDQNEKELKKRKDKSNPHYWEVGRKSFPKKRILNLCKDLGFKVVKNFHNPNYAYHWYILMENHSK